MQHVDLNRSDTQQFPTDSHLITFFDDQFAAVKYEDVLTLPQLAAEIRDFSADSKARLPFLKMARFGETRSRKNCLRTDANTVEVTGLEIDYDDGAMLFDDAIKAMKAARIRSLLYTSASYVKGRREKWRILAPFSKGYPAEYRAEMVAIVNGIIGGVAGAESFILSQSFYYGSVKNNPEHRVEVVDGDFVDLRPDLAAEAIGRAGKAAAKAHIVPEDRKPVTPGRDDAEILQLLRDSRKKNPHGGGQWHNSMLSISATMIGRGWSDAEIFSACAEYCDGHWGDEELAEMIESGRAKWRAPDPDKIARGIMPVVAAAIVAKGGEVPNFNADFPVGTTRDDYYAFLPTHQYIYRHTGRLYPLATINAILGKVTIGSKPKRQTKKQIEAGCEPEKVAKQIPASLWLDRNRPVMEMSWAPGEPQLIEGKLACEGGWIERAGVASFNLYRPPAILSGNSGNARRWIDLIERLYRDHTGHIIAFCAHRVQRPAEKINHGLVLTGSPGIGKDTLLEPVKYGVGPWNFKEASPQNIMGDHNDFMRSVVLRISETRDLGDINRYAFYETCKTMLAAPPDMARVNIKHVPQFYVPNVTGVIFTTNYPTDGLYLTADDRRHYVCGTETGFDDPHNIELPEIWEWYGAEGIADVIAYLGGLQLSDFDAKRPPAKTAAFWRLVDGGTASEVPELRDAIEQCGGGSPPAAVTKEMVLSKANHELQSWLRDPKHARALPHRFDNCGYAQVRNPGSADGFWKIGGRRQVVYCFMELSYSERLRAAEKLKIDGDRRFSEQKGKVVPFLPSSGS